MASEVSRDVTRDLLSFIDKCPSAFHAVATAAGALEEAGYTRLFERDAWHLTLGGKYYVTRGGSSIIAFRLPAEELRAFALTASHCDFPSFKIKENGELFTPRLVRLSTERYGGMILSTWLDRPLSVAGRVILRGEDGKLRSRLVALDRDLLLIPNTAIHLNHSLNEGFRYNPAVDMLPLFGDGREGEGGFWRLIAREAGAAPEDILGQDLYLFNRTPGSIWGGEGEFVSSRSLDDLQCVFATLRGLLTAGESSDTAAVCAIFDSEEVGSQTRQGAASTFLPDALRRAAAALGEGGAEDYRRLLARSFLLSCDNAHAVHPNHPELSDQACGPRLNGGVVLKHNAAQKYTTDGYSAALVHALAERAGVPLQPYANRADMAGGSTLGGILLRGLPVAAADIGLPQLAMHSSYETAGTEDTAQLTRLVAALFEELPQVE